MKKSHTSKYISLLLLGVMLIVGFNQAEASTGLEALAIGKGERGTVAFEFKVIQTSSKLVKGEFFAVNPGIFTVEGTIDCAWIDGNIAVFGGTNKLTDSPFTVMVSDKPDGIIIGLGRPNCDTTGFGIPIPITAGNITVVDPN